jgi:hypothetical protein
LAFAILLRTGFLPPSPPAEKPTCTFLDASMIQLVQSSLAKGFNFFSSVETRFRNSFMTL